MEIEGLQKLTLLDFPGRVACTVFTPGCNFRCPFCQNASLVIDAPVKGAEDIEEFFSFLSKRKGILDGVAITGGEPLLQKEIDGFISRIRELPASPAPMTMTRPPNSVSRSRLRRSRNHGRSD